MTTSKHHNLLAGVLLAAAIAVALLAIPASASSPLKITNCTKTASKPKQVTLSCGDGNTYVKNLSWSSFGGATAQGKGTFVTNTCKPNCASGKNVSYPASVTASGSKNCKKAGNVYGKLTLTFTGSKKPGSSVPRKWTLFCPAG